MNAFHFMQSLVAVLVVLMILDILTTFYGMRKKIAYEDNGIVAAVMHFTGLRAGGLILVKLPFFGIAALACFPLFFAKLGVPNAALVWAADIPDWSWYGQIALYAIVVGNNIRIIWKHVLADLDEEKGLSP